VGSFLIYPLVPKVIIISPRMPQIRPTLASVGHKIRISTSFLVPCDTMTIILDGQKSIVMKISGTGSALPKKIVTNEMLSQFIETSDEWIRTRTGIVERHVISDERLEDLAVEAAEAAMRDAGIAAGNIDFIICSNVVNEFITPQLSCIIQGGIGASCPCMDINCACAGFIHALEIAESFYKAGRVQNVLIVCAEEPTRMADWSDRRTCVLFGDGAGAVVLTPGDKIRSIKLSASSSTDKLWQLRTLLPTPYINKEEKNVPLMMKGRDVYKFAVNSAIKDICRALDETGMSKDDVDHYLLHQANLRIIDAIQKYMEQPKEKFPTNIENNGNSSSASCPILLDECNRKGVFKKGDIIAMSAFGAGFVSGAVIFEW